MGIQGGVILSRSGRSFTISFRGGAGGVLIVPPRSLWKVNRWRCRLSRLGNCSGDAATTGLCGAHTMLDEHEQGGRAYPSAFRLGCEGCAPSTTIRPRRHPITQRPRDSMPAQRGCAVSEWVTQNPKSEPGIS